MVCSTISSLFCSELVAESYKRLGLIDRASDRFSNNYTPNDFSSDGIGVVNLTEEFDTRWSNSEIQITLTKENVNLPDDMDTRDVFGHTSYSDGVMLKAETSPCSLARTTTAGALVHADAVERKDRQPALHASQKTEEGGLVWADAGAEKEESDACKVDVSDGVALEPSGKAPSNMN